MDDEIYKPSMIVAKLAARLHATPIRERIELDGRITILFSDGRKMYFDKDAITRTLTEPESMDLEHPVQPVEDADTGSPKPRIRKQKG